MRYWCVLVDNLGRIKAFYNQKKKINRKRCYFPCNSRSIITVLYNKQHRDLSQGKYSASVFADLLHPPKSPPPVGTSALHWTVESSEQRSDWSRLKVHLCWRCVHTGEFILWPLSAAPHAAMPRWVGIFGEILSHLAGEHESKMWFDGRQKVQCNSFDYFIRKTSNNNHIWGDFFFLF